MATASSPLLTRSHRRELALVAGLIVRRVDAAARRAAGDIDDWWEREAPELEQVIVIAYGVTATTAARYLRRHAAAAGVLVEPVRAVPNREQISTSLRVAGPVAFKRQFRDSASYETAARTMSAMLRGSAQRLTLAGERETVLATVRSADSIAGYRRVTSGRACPFCSSLAGRIARADTGAAFPAHDSCSCTAEPVYG